MKINYEDVIMKKAMEVFGKEGLKFLGINKKIKSIGPTELVHLDIKTLYMDYTYLMEDDTYIHFEFQTTNKPLDLLRFRVYESLLNYKTNKSVTTYVIYSGNIKNPKSKHICGINTYKVNSISLVDKDGDIIYNNIINKFKNGDTLTKNDMLSLVFTPLMGGKINIIDKIKTSIKITNTLKIEHIDDVKAILYALANKFLTASDFKKNKEEFKMTELGKMLFEEGKESGKLEGKIESILTILQVKFNISNNIINEINKLDDKKLSNILKNISNINSLSDLKKFF